MALYSQHDPELGALRIYFANVRKAARKFNRAAAAFEVGGVDAERLNARMVGLEIALRNARLQFDGMFRVEE